MNALSLRYLDKNMKYKRPNSQGIMQPRIVHPPYPIKEKYNMIIPPCIFQTWHSKELPHGMNAAVNYLRRVNPNFKYYLFDDNDCREFIKTNFESKILDAYDSLIPGAFKADLWRYCVLYKHGGIYLDIKYMPIKGFKLINLTEKEHFCLDVDGDGIYNAIMACLPRNSILERAIYQIAENVRTKYYGSNSLEPTGPKLLARYFSNEDKRNMNLKHIVEGSIHFRYILCNNYYVLKSFPGYLDEHNKFKKVDYYDTLWKKRNIYR
jgi:mannosyltransferase OCH1-like enzyme